MPGVCGVVDLSTPDLSVLLAAMTGSLRHFDWQVAVSEVSSHGGLGAVIVNPPGAAVLPVLGHWRDLVVAFDGELYDTSRLLDGSTLPDRVARTIGELGTEAITRSHGSFTCAVWDHKRLELRVLSDRFGTRPLYWTRSRGRFLFASEIKGLFAVPGVASNISEEGLAQFLAFGQYLGSTTLYQDIELAPAGRELIFSAAAGTVSVSDRVPLEASSPTASTDAQWLELIETRLRDAVAQACGGDQALGLSLSGGLDARTILAVAPAGRSLRCVSLGIPGSLDHRASSKLASLAGQSHHMHLLAGDFLQRFESLLAEMVFLTDAQYLDQGIVLTTLPMYRELGVHVLLRGHAGELMHMWKAYAYSLDDRAIAISSKAELADWLWTHLSDYMIGSVDESFFAGPFRSKLRDMARAALERQLSEWDDVEPVPQRIWRMFVAERLRRETMLSLQLFRNFVEVRVPFLEPRLVSALLAAPQRLKVGDDIQTHILGRRPEFLRVVNANTGARVGAGKALVRLSHFKLRVLAKLGVPGYQPYERLGSWLAHDLRPWLKRLLVDQEAAVGLIEPPEWEGLIEQHASRSRNHTFLLMAGAILSSGRRQVRSGRQP
jgi:asparagine synthase (glutamine-hydrolysing)